MEKQQQQPGSDPRRHRPPPPASPRPAPQPRPPRPPLPARPHVAVANTHVVKLTDLGTCEVNPLHVPEADTHSSDQGSTGPRARNLTSSGGNPTVSPGVSTAVPKENRQNEGKRRPHITEQGDAAIKRPKIKDGTHPATEAQGKFRAVPMQVTATWNEASGNSKPTLKTQSKDATESTIAETQDIQNAHCADDKTGEETDSIDNDSIEDSNTELSKQLAESIHPAPLTLCSPGGSRNEQPGATLGIMQQREPGPEVGRQKEQLQRNRGPAPMATVPQNVMLIFIPCIVTARRIVPPAARRSASENAVTDNTTASAPLGRQIGSGSRGISGDSDNQTGAAAKANNKSLLTDIGNRPAEESNLQPAAQNPHGDRCEEGF